MASPATIHKTQLNDGTLVPTFAWGSGSGNARNTALVSGRLALKAGFRHIDTAQGYNTEVEAGEAIKAVGLPKEDVFVTSKLSGPNFESIPVSEVRSNIEASIDKLGFIPDLYIIHNPYVVEPYPDLKKAWKVLEDMKDEGRLKAIGVSNFRPQDLELVIEGAKHIPAVNQLEFHPYVLAHLQPVLDIQMKHNIVTEAYGPLTPLLRHPIKAASFIAGGAGGGPLLPVLQRIAGRINKEHPAVPVSVSNRLPTKIDEAAILLLWTKAMGAVVVSSSASEKNIQWLGEIAILPDGLLTPEEVEEITNVGKKVHFRHYIFQMGRKSLRMQEEQISKAMVAVEKSSEARAH